MRAGPDMPRLRARVWRVKVVRDAEDGRRTGGARQLRAEDDGWRLRHARDGTAGEVAQGRQRPRVEVGRQQRAPGARGNERVEHVLRVRLDAVDAAVGEEAVEVVVEGRYGVLGDDGHLAVDGQPALVELVARDGDRLVALGERPIGSEAGPVAEHGVPDDDMLNVLVFGSDVRDECFEAPGELLGLGFKVFQPLLPLTSPVVNVLPVVVDD